MPPLIALITVALLAAPAPESTSSRGPLTREAVVAARRVGLWNNGQTDTSIYALATVVIGGLISASLLTLLVLPAVYARFGPRTATPAS